MEKERYDYIDTLRLCSILFIVLSHFDGECFYYLTGISMMQVHLARDGRLGLLMYGWTGKYALALLCVISGFLTAVKYAGKKECDVGGFVISRYFRLMLPVMASTFLFGIVLKLKGEPVNMAAYLKTAVVPGWSEANRNLWCIGAFLVGNILVCLLYYLQERGFQPIVLYPGLLLLLVLLGEVWVVATVAGGFCYEAASRLKRSGLVGNWCLLGIIPMVWLLPRGEESTAIYYRDIAAAMLIVASFYCLPVLQRIFACRFLGPLKRCCYSLFVVHGMTYFLLGPAWNLVQKCGFSKGSIIYICLFAIIFCIDLLAAFVVYYLSEVKLYRMIVKRFLPDR